MMQGDMRDMRMEAGTPRRRLGNFRTPELAGRIREVLAAAGIPSSGEPDPGRPERVGRLLDWVVHMTGVGGNRVWVPRDRFREAVGALAEARRRGERPSSEQPPSEDEGEGGRG
jgi:hypothetical protein